eukprot:Phypoly_transcript_10881.p1 GENE.Phypoly_transcript_10881~~Phypoly_transcript_10881.p1  ORF type:complete len:355 (-),score=70.03 Phypoly_transcript_10881:129-1193(-)
MQHQGEKGKGKGEHVVKKPALAVPRDPEGFTVAFDVTQEAEIQDFFNKFGFVVVRDVLTQEDCKNTLDEIYSILENGTQFKRGDVGTWSNWPADSIERYGSPHKPPVFTPQFLRNRQNPNVYKVFSQLLHEDKLLSNHDRCCFFRPTVAGKLADGQVLRANKPTWGTSANLHIDMNPFQWLGDGAMNRFALSQLRYDRLSNFIFENNQPSHSDGVQLQGVLNLAENLEEDGGFQCVPGFHLEFDQYMATRPKNDNASYNFSAKEEPYHRGTRVPMRAGSMVVWDQRMAHGSQPNASSHFRSAQFIKLFPHSTVDPQRARARALVLWDQIKKAGMEKEITDLGRVAFGLEYLPSK